jgi:hypothetical protein
MKLRLRAIIIDLLIASVYAVCMSKIATVKSAGVGIASVAPIAWPSICVDVQNWPLISWTRLNPVRAAAVTGLTPTFPPVELI